MKIAQQFTAGLPVVNQRSPGGTTENNTRSVDADYSSRPNRGRALRAPEQRKSTVNILALR
jgi:hypothetical protein